MHKESTMGIIRAIYILLAWILILSSCTPPPVETRVNPSKIKDTNGNLHYYTMYRLTSFDEPVRYCELHEQWERVENLTNYQRAQNTKEIIN